MIIEESGGRMDKVNSRRTMGQRPRPTEDGPSRIYFASTPYHLLLSFAIQERDHHPDAALLFADEAGFLSHLANALDFVRSQFDYVPVPTTAPAGTFSEALVSRRRERRTSSLAGPLIGAEDLYLFNAQTPAARRLVRSFAGDIRLQYVEDGLDAYLPCNLLPVRRWRRIAHHVAFGHPHPYTLDMTTAATFAGYHVLLPDLCRAPAPTDRIHEIPAASLRNAVSVFAPFLPGIAEHGQITHLYLAGHSSRRGTGGLMADVDDWLTAVRATAPNARPAVKAHPRESSSDILTRFRRLKGVSALPHWIPGELLGPYLAPEVQICTGLTTFIVSSRVLIPHRSILLDHNVAPADESLLRGWDASIERLPDPAGGAKGVHPNRAPRSTRPAVPRSISAGPATLACITSGTSYATKGPDDPRAWLAEAATIRGHRLSAVALRLLESGSNPELMGTLREGARRDATLTMMAEMAAAPGLVALNEAGIRFVVIKGAAAARFHPDPDARAYVDLDLLVAPRDFRRAANTLSQLGYQRKAESELPWQSFDRFCVEGFNFHKGVAANIDLHHHLSPWCFGSRLKAEDLYRRAELANIGGVPVRVASGADCLLACCLHVVNDLGKDDPSYRSWRDIAIIADQLEPDEFSEAFDHAGLSWFEPFIRTGLAELGAPLSVRPPARALDRAHALLPRWRLGLMGWNDSSLLSRHPLGWALRLPPPRAAMFLAGSAIPSRTYVRARYGSYSHYWQGATRSVIAAWRGTDFRHDPIGSLRDRSADREALHDRLEGIGRSA